MTRPVPAWMAQLWQRPAPMSVAVPAVPSTAAGGDVGPPLPHPTAGPSAREVTAARSPTQTVAQHQGFLCRANRLASTRVLADRSNLVEAWLRGRVASLREARRGPRPPSARRLARSFPTPPFADTALPFSQSKERDGIRHLVPHLFACVPCRRTGHRVITPAAVASMQAVSANRGPGCRARRQYGSSKPNQTSARVSSAP